MASVANAKQGYGLGGSDCELPLWMFVWHGWRMVWGFGFCFLIFISTTRLFCDFFNALDATVCFKMARCCCARLYCDYQMSLDGSVDF